MSAASEPAATPRFPTVTQTGDSILADALAEKLPETHIKSQEQSDPLNSFRPPLFALIIGINTYDVHPLTGCVRDADSVEEYLRKDLLVPDRQITRISNKEATRARIIDELNALALNPDIKHGDAILIFYAGHGNSVAAPPQWEAGGARIQILVPCDCHLSGGVLLNSIPDREFGALLESIARVKGDNITVILDSCHSGSGTRDDNIEDRLCARTFQLPEGTSILTDFDNETRGAGPNSGTIFISEGFLQTGLRSHVLLAACSANETAKEDIYIPIHRGLFTRELLRTLRRVGAEKLTYSALISRMNKLRYDDPTKGDPIQNPQCEGFNRDRVLFDNKAPSYHSILHRVSLKGNEYFLDAGVAHGISKGAEFSVYKDYDSFANALPLGTLVVRSTDQAESVMDLTPGTRAFPLPQPGLALQTLAGIRDGLRLYAAKDEALDVILRGIIAKLDSGVNNPNRWKIVLSEKETADFGVALENNRVVFYYLSADVIKHGASRIPFTADPDVDKLLLVIGAMIDFIRNLRQRNTQPLLENVRPERVEVGFYRLEGKNIMSRRPVGSNLNVNGTVNIVADKDAVYGLKIVNHTQSALYVSLLYFDNSSLTVFPCNQILSNLNPEFIVDHNLLPSGTLPVGYGAGGAAPMSFALANEEDVSVGFLKLLFASKPVDFSYMLQASPFVQDPLVPRGMTLVYTDPGLFWDSSITTVRITRPRKEA